MIVHGDYVIFRRDEYNVVLAKTGIHTSGKKKGESFTRPLGYFQDLSGALVALQRKLFDEHTDLLDAEGKQYNLLDALIETKKVYKNNLNLLKDFTENKLGDGTC